jgi:hypothetical protein
VFADDAVIFAPSAVNGKKFWREAKEKRQHASVIPSVVEESVTLVFW